MPRQSRQNPAIREFILRNVAEHPRDINVVAAKQFGISRAATGRYTAKLIDEGLLIAEGKTRSRIYKLKSLAHVAFELDVNQAMSEDTVWRFRILPSVKGVPQNVVNICQYGFTEILNNVIDHSESVDVYISYSQTYKNIEILICDRGIGIFEKIRKDFNLPDARSALLELSKGKLTSNTTRHTGEGIFFTSRMFDEFSIRSGNLFYTRVKQKGADWLVETQDLFEYCQGTRVNMVISTDAAWTTKEVFDQYQGDDVRFRRTHVPIKLGLYPGEQLVSRSQAKRILSRFENFSEVLLDFSGVEGIGQAFADEIFRVFASDHPEIALIAINTDPEVKRSIDAAQAMQREASLRAPQV